MGKDHKDNTMTMLSMQSKSPRSLQAKNTKNLSLNIKYSKIAVEAENMSSIPNISAKPIVIGDTQQQAPKSSTTSLKNGPSPISKRCESSIYSLPKTVCTSPLYTARKCRSNTNLNSLSNKNARLHSLSLSVKTKELQRSASVRIRSQTIPSAFETSTPQVSSNQQKRIWVMPENARPSLSPEDVHPSFGSFEEKTNLLYSEAYKENAYPDGPLLVIPPNLYLYSEPSLDEVLSFDVVINVAKEITNFKNLIPAHQKIDYHHIPWTHSSKISLDLDYLTEIIQNAITSGKKVLVHCQCGVSRSASLIVAYIMKYHEMSLNDAYSHLKHIAKDISPNMGLIFQLMEWSENSSKLRDPGMIDRQEAELNGSEHLEGSQQAAPDKVEPDLESCGMPIPNLSSQNDISLSPETTPITPCDYFKNTSSSSSSSSSASASTSTSSSTIVESQPLLKTIELSPGLESYLPSYDSAAATDQGHIWG